MTISKMKLGIAFGALAALGLVSVTLAPASATTPPTCAHQLKVVKTAWSKAAAGPKKDEAKVHYDNAVADHKKKDDKSCLSELDLATAALK
jgi:hypothetical protein